MFRVAKGVGNGERTQIVTHAIRASVSYVNASMLLVCTGTYEYTYVYVAVRR